LHNTQAGRLCHIEKPSLLRRPGTGRPAKIKIRA